MLDYVVDVVAYNADQTQLNNAASLRTRTKGNPNPLQRTKKYARVVRHRYPCQVLKMLPIREKSNGNEVSRTVTYGTTTRSLLNMAT